MNICIKKTIYLLNEIVIIIFTTTSFSQPSNLNQQKFENKIII